MILDLELEYVWDNLKPTFLNDLVKSLSDRIKEQPLLLLTVLLAFLQTLLNLTNSFALRNFRTFLLSFLGMDSQMAVTFT
jgi:hypothetical protein